MPSKVDTLNTVMNFLARVTILLIAMLWVPSISRGQTAQITNGDDQRPNATIIRPRSSVSGQTSTTEEATSSIKIQTSSEFPTLSPRTKETSEDKGARQKSGITSSAITVASSLLIVLGLFAVLVWFSRKINTKSHGRNSAMGSLIEPLGSHVFDPKTQMHVIRFSNRILLVSQTNGVLQKLCEIDEPAEVQTILNTFDWDPNNEFATAAKRFDSDNLEATE